ncbi:MAG: GNAT family N-acetyltransferase [Actinomycetota bacterium]
MAVATTIRPLTTARWPDLEALFRGHGNPGYCWCMRWRAAGRTFTDLGSRGRHDALRSAVERRIPTGVLAYRRGDPVGWCSVAPRDTYEALERSRVMARIDDEPVWSIACFFVARPARGTGVQVALLEGAVAHAHRRGARLVEAYPVGPEAVSYRLDGHARAVPGAGFTDVSPPGRTRRVMRRLA